MTSLTHVCMWKNKGWERITAAEAAKLHPIGGVSANSGLFMCELCGQYVSLTNGSCRDRYFKHSRSEKNKDCPERVLGTHASMTYDFSDHELPMRIKNITRKNFEFELGFIPVPYNLNSKQMKIIITSKGYEENKYIYSGERLNIDGITYLSIGENPSTEFIVNVEGVKDDIYKFWPRKNNGIISSGTVFDANTGRKMVYDADVIIGKKYFILCINKIDDSQSEHVSIKEISCKEILSENWKIFEVLANDYSEESAKFFLKYHCRLTESPIDIQQIWPIYIENKYVIKHNQRNMFLHIKGNASNIVAFPETYKQKFDCYDETILKIECNSRQQLISAGRTKALNYAYFWKEELDGLGDNAKAQITDIRGNFIDSEQMNTLPENGKVLIKTQYDGFVEIIKNDKIVDKRLINEDRRVEIAQITWGTQISIFVGLDLIKKIKFMKVNTQTSNNENSILEKLNSFSGKKIKVSHTIGSLAARLDEYPKIKMWLYKRIRENSINEQAYKYLIFIIERKVRN